MCIYTHTHIFSEKGVPTPERQYKTGTKVDEPEGQMLHNINQRKEKRYYMISLIYEILRNGIHRIRE